MRSVATILCGLFAVLAFDFAAPEAASARGRTASAVAAATNAARYRHGVSGLRWSRPLARAARRHSGHMARTGVFAHGAFSRRIARFSRAASVGENLAWVSNCGRGTGRRIVAMWLNSPAHRAVLLSHGYRRVGIGVRRGWMRGMRVCLVTADFSS